MKDLFSSARRSRRVRRAANASSVVVSLALVALTARWFLRTGVPLSRVDGLLAGVATACFLAAAAVKAWGWSRLFAVQGRPRATTLAAAGGVATLAGIAVPGRLDDALRIAVVRRFSRSSATVGAIALSLFTLGLVDTVAMTPLASTAAASVHGVLLRTGLCVVAAAGVGAAVFLLALPRVAASTRFVGFRLSGWLHEQWPSARQAGSTLAWVSASWLTRTVGVFVLLAALGLHVSFPLALVFTCVGAAASALPFAPAGAVAQAGAGASVLIAAGIPASGAVEVAVAAQLVTAVAACCVVLAAAGDAAARRYLIA